MSEKRYSPNPQATPWTGYTGVPSWTARELAELGGFPWYVTDLARDLIAAQARIAELDSQATWFSKIARETTDKLAAAEATIAELRACNAREAGEHSTQEFCAARAHDHLRERAQAAEATISRVKRIVRAWDAVRVHGGIYSQREAQLVDDLEAALAGPKDGE